MADYLRDFAMMGRILPASVNGLIVLAQTRSALQSGTPDWAMSTAQKGITALEQSEPDTPSGPSDYLRALRAALTALLATAQRRSDPSAEHSLKNFELADATFSELIDSMKPTIAPFLSDYLLLLVEFGETDKAFSVAEKLTGIVQRWSANNRGAASLAWLRATLISPTPRMMLALGESLHAQNNPTSAIEEFLRATAIALASKELPAALEAVEKILSIDPKSADAHCIRGVLRWRSGHVRGAQDDFFAAVDAKPDNFEAHLALAQTWLKLDVPREALVHLNIIGDHLKTIDLLWLRAETEIRLGSKDRGIDKGAAAERHWETAIRILDEALQRDSRHAQSRRSRAIALYNLNRLEESLQDVEEALQSDPNDVVTHGWKAAVLQALGKDVESLAAVNIALALMGTDSSSLEQRAWLLKLKGRALLNNRWLDQAVEVLTQAVYLSIEDEDLARDLLKAHKQRQNWKALARCARSLQTNPYGEGFLRYLRREEIVAWRNLGDYGAAFDSLDRSPELPADDPGTIWLRARLLADIGDFESAAKILAENHPDALHYVDHLSLRAWAIQNLEARDPKHRIELGEESLGLYRNAIEAADKDRADGVWLRKGLANALLRQGNTEEAFNSYHSVIADCEERVKLVISSPRILALIGWCWHCVGEHATALRCYEAAIDRGENSIAVEFDYDLAYFATGRDQDADAASAEDRYQATVQKGLNEDVLRRIGLLRVALHDLREFLFLNPELILPQARRIGQMLSMELLEAVEKLDARFDALSEHIHDFLMVAMSDPLGISVLERDALRLRMEAGRFIREKNLPRAVEELQKAAETYRQLKLRVWSAKTWRDISHLCKGQDEQASCQAACKSLLEGIYKFDAETGREFIALATNAAAAQVPLTIDYRSLIQAVFAEAGPDIAYLDAAKILEKMPVRSQQLFIETVSSVFPVISPAGRWNYVGQGADIRQIPNIDRIMGPFLRNRRLLNTAELWRKAMA